MSNIIFNINLENWEKKFSFAIQIEQKRKWKEYEDSSSERNMDWEYLYFDDSTQSYLWENLTVYTSENFHEIHNVF